MSQETCSQKQNENCSWTKSTVSALLDCFRTQNFFGHTTVTVLSCIKLCLENHNVITLVLSASKKGTVRCALNITIRNTIVLALVNTKQQIQSALSGQLLVFVWFGRLTLKTTSNSISLPRTCNWNKDCHTRAHWSDWQHCFPSSTVAHPSVIFFVCFSSYSSKKKHFDGKWLRFKGYLLKHIDSVQIVILNYSQMQNAQFLPPS